jgi:nucleoside-diphosphate-sugar epimerase
VDVDDKPMPSDDPGRRKPDISLARELLGSVSCHYYHCNNYLLTDECRWEPQVPLREGLKRAVAYFRTIV